MACCALAVFIIGQFYSVNTAIRTRLGVGGAAESTNAASGWRPGMTVGAASARSTFQLRLAAVIFFASFGALAVAVVGFASIAPEGRAAHIRAMLADPIRWCGHKFNI